MNTVQIPRVVIAGTNSGVGKTTIVAGLLAAYANGGRTVQSFKVGPDYIDPGFHKIASGRDSYNLDTWLVPPHKLNPFFATMANGVDLAIIEGVMGLYDGGREGVSSTAQIAKQLNAPVVLVIDCKAMGESAAAIAKGFRDYDSEVNFGGVILNRLGSANHERMVREGMAKIGVPVIGAIYRDDRMHSPERHLGLTPVTEIDPTEAINTIREAVEKMVKLDQLLEIASSAPSIELPDAVDPKSVEKRVKIGVAYDEAFSFYYPASLAALEEKGAEIVYFSPLNDFEVPDGLSQDSLHMLMTCEPQIKEIGDLISRTDVLLFGIGTAMRMADQRHIADDVRKQLVDNHAVGEALGQYCDIDGKLIYSTNNIGLSLPDVAKIPNVIAVAGGQDKSSAIIGVMRACQKSILIIDEQAAEGMRQLLQISAL